MSESLNGKTINVSIIKFVQIKVLLMIQFRVHLITHLEWHLKVNFNIYIYKYAQEGAPDLY